MHALLVILFPLLTYAKAPQSCFTARDVQDEGCRALCVRDGYTSGLSRGRGCMCLDGKDSYADYMRRTTSLGPREMTPQEIKEGLAAPRQESVKAGTIYVTPSYLTYPYDD